MKATGERPERVAAVGVQRSRTVGKAHTGHRNRIAAYCCRRQPHDITRPHPFSQLFVKGCGLQMRSKIYFPEQIIAIS